MTNTERKELKRILVQVIIDHWGKFLDKKLKQDLIGKKKNSWIDVGEDLEFILYSTLSRSRDSSMGNLYEKILFEISKFFNDKTYGKVNGLKIRKSGKNWIIDLAFERDGKTYLIEIKLGGELDNKKAKSEAEALQDRKEALIENKLASNVETYLGVITLTKGEDSSENWVMGRVSEGFDRSEVLVERELFDFVSNDTDVFDFIKDEIQPFVMQEWKTVKEKIKSTYL